MNSLDALKKEGASTYRELKWQEISDSPTVKSYTDWSRYEKYLGLEGDVRCERPEGNYDFLVGDCGNVEPSYDYKGYIKVNEGKLAAYHFYELERFYKIKVSSGKHKIAFCVSKSKKWVSNHLILEVEKGSKASVVVYEQRRSPGSTAIEVLLDEGADLEFSIILEPDESFPSAYIIRKVIYSEGSANSFTFSTSSYMNRIEERNLLFKGSKLRHKSLVYSYRDLKVDNIIDTIQIGEGSEAYVAGLGMAFDSSLSSIRGTAIISEGARKSVSDLGIEALLIGDGARAYTMPMMKIDTGDVTAANHRASQQRLSRNLLFYLGSRGLSEEESTSLVLYEKSVSMLNHLSETRSFSEDKVKGVLKKIYLEG